MSYGEEAHVPASGRCEAAPAASAAAQAVAPMKLTYAVVFEQTPNNYAAYVSDVPGCVSTGQTWDEMQAMIREALAFHLESLLEDGEPLPQPKMSIDDAIAHHREPIPEDALATHAEYGDPVPTISTSFHLVEIEVPAPQPTVT